MQVEPIQALQAASRPAGPSGPRKPILLVAGATGVLGNEVLHRVASSPDSGGALVLAKEPMRTGMRGIDTLLVPEGPVQDWPLSQGDVGLIMFEPPRLFYDRERALWTPQPAQLLQVAQWMQASGVTTLAVVLPHAQGRLPEALKRGLASLDEQAVSALGFERFIIVRSAQKPAAPASDTSLPQRLANSMLSIVRLMVPSSEQPVRAVKVAELVLLALQTAPPGIHVAAPELVWQAAQGDMRAIAAQWLG